MDIGLSADGRVASIGGTLLGLGLLALGVALAAGTGLELLLASGRPLAAPVGDVWRGPVGLVTAIAGYLLLRRVARRDGAHPDDEGHSEAGTMYLWDM